jgi:hypothetical protein
MSRSISSFVTISCDAPGCEKNATFPQTQQGEQEAIAVNPWIGTVRFVVVPGPTAESQRNLTYCSDECEVLGTSGGSHNQGPTRVQLAANQAQIELAAKAAQLHKQNTAALKTGNGSVVLG